MNYASAVKRPGFTDSNSPLRVFHSILVLHTALVALSLEFVCVHWECDENQELDNCYEAEEGQLLQKIIRAGIF